MPRSGVTSDLVYDVGLHRGEDSAHYLARGFRVIAFEANPALIAHCEKRFRREIAEGRLRIVEGAIDDTGAETVTFYQHPNNTEWGTTAPTWAERNLVRGESVPIEVPTVAFIDIVRETGVPYFVKIDIEGADLVCLRGLSGFEAQPTYVSLESTKDDFQALLEEFELLETLGYNRFAVVQQAGIAGTELATTSVDGTAMTYRFEPDCSGAFGPDVGPWLDREAALARYRQVFRMYRLLGDASLLRRSKLGRGVRGQLSRHLGKPLPGWYDTHATRVTE